MTGRVPVACEAHKDDLAALALGEPLGAREASLRAHLDTCPGCRAYHAAMLRTLGAVRALPQPEPPEEMTERILQAARRSQRATLLPASGLVARWLESLAAAFRRPLLASAVAAVAIASAAVVLLVLSREETPAPPSGATGPRIARFEAPAVEMEQPAAAAPPAAVSAAPAEAPVPEAAPVPAAPEVVVLVTPAAPPAVEDVSVERAQDEGRQPEDQERAALQTRGPAAGAGRADTDRGSRLRAAPVAAPPAEPEGADRTGGRFSPGREVGAGGGGSDDVTVVVGGRSPSAVRDETAWGATDGMASAGEAQGLATGATTVPTVTGVLGSDEESGGNATRRPGGAAAAQAPSPPPPPPPSGAPATPPAVVRSTETAYSGSGGVGTDSVVVFAAPAAGAPAQAEERGYYGIASDAAAAEESYRSEGEAETATDRVATARRQLAEGDAAQAETVLEQALQEQTARAADVTFLLAETYARQGKWADAARTYELFLARYLDDPRADEARWRAADAYRRSGNATRAAALLRQLLAVPGYADRARTALAEISAPAAGGAEPPAVDATAGEAAPVPAMAVPAETP